jgi:hypothetical protein
MAEGAKIEKDILALVVLQRISGKTYPSVDLKPYEGYQRVQF